MKINLLGILSLSLVATIHGTEHIDRYNHQRDHAFIKNYLDADKINFPDAHLMPDYASEVVEIPLADELKKAMPGVIFKAERQRTYVYLLDDKPVAFIRYWIMFGQGFIAHIGVIKEQRRKGIAKKLMHFALADLKAVGIKTVMLDSVAQNVEAHKFYTTLGFSKTEGKEHCFFHKNV